MYPEAISQHNANSFESTFNDNFRAWAIEHLVIVTGVPIEEFPPLTDEDIWQALITIGTNQPFDFDESRLTLGQSLAISLGILLDTDQLPEGDCLMDLFNRLPEKHGFSVPHFSEHENNVFLCNIASTLAVALGFTELSEYCPPPITDEALKELIESSPDEIESLRSM